MVGIQLYLHFDGNCEEAFEFYSKALNTPLQDVNRFNEMPPQEGAPPLPEEMGNRIMHVSLNVGEHTVLMGSDTMPGMGPGHQPGNNFSISYAPDSRSEADRAFEALAEGGQVIMPMEEAFWGAYFGMLVDKFGISWMVNTEAKQ